MGGGYWNLEFVRLKFVWDLGFGIWSFVRTLDFAPGPFKTPGVFSARASFYSQWRTSLRPYGILRENNLPPEALLQNIWHHQRLLRDELKLTDGRAVRVLHPGFWNHGAGPDFREAVLQFGSEPPVTGDVEIDLQLSGWKAHGHDRNPNFKNVRLHVLWESAAGEKSLPTLALRPFLDAPLVELALWLTTDAAQKYPEGLLGQCAGPLRDLSLTQLEQLLNEAALVRFERKAADLHARARQCGWEQSLWEGMLRALGYRHNVWPMQRVGELRGRLLAVGQAPPPVTVHQAPPLGEPAGEGARDTNASRGRLAHSGSSSLIAVQARLLGLSGLLPHDLTRQQRSADTYLRTVWDHWWRERDAFSDCALPKTLWKLNGLRPANHPHRRLALAAHWAGDAKLFKRIDQWFITTQPDKALDESLLKCLQPEADEFWSRHWTLRSAAMPKPQPLLGATRATDLAINVILPWLWLRAREGGNAKLQAEAERRYFVWPAAEDNSVLRLARDRLLGGRRDVKLANAAMQQGVLQVVSDFCHHSNALCADCKFPELVKNWRVGAA